MQFTNFLSLFTFSNTDATFRVKFIRKFGIHFIVIVIFYCLLVAICLLVQNLFKLTVNIRITTLMCRGNTSKLSETVSKKRAILLAIFSLQYIRFTELTRCRGPILRSHNFLSVSAKLTSTPICRTKGKYCSSSNLFD